MEDTEQSEDREQKIVPYHTPYIEMSEPSAKFIYNTLKVTPQQLCAVVSSPFRHCEDVTKSRFRFPKPQFPIFHDTPQHRW